MKYIYYCKNCGYVGSMEGENSVVNCTKCGAKLLATGLDREIWVGSTSEEKAAYKVRWATEDEPMQSTPGTSFPQSSYTSDYTTGSTGKNSVGTLIQVIAIITYIAALLVGIALGKDMRGNFSFTAALVYWVVGFISGSMLLGFAEIIQLLQAIKNK